MKSTKMLKGLASILLIFIVMLASLATSQSASYDENFNEWFGIGVANDDAKPTNVDEQLNNDRQLINDTNGDKRAVQPVGDLKTEQLEPAMVAQVAPGAPTGLVATLGDRQITLSWNAYYTDLDVYFFYEVGYKRSDESEWTNTVLVTSPFITIYSLTNRIKYDFRVCVRLLDYPPPYNYATISATPVGPTAPPIAPRNLTAVPGDGQVALSWELMYTFPELILFYQVGYKRSSDNVWTNCEVFIPSITVTDLTNGVEYDFRVRFCLRDRMGENRPPFDSDYATISATPR